VTRVYLSASDHLGRQVQLIQAPGSIPWPDHFRRWPGSRPTRS